MKKKKVVIMGGGPAGLTAAYYLLKNSNDYDVTIIEQEDKVGGISKTIIHNGYRFDIGTHRFFTKNEEIENIWEDLLPIQSKPAYDDIILNKNRVFPKEGSDPEIDEKSMLIKDRLTRIYYDKKFYDYPIELNFNTIKNMGFFTLMKAGFSYLKSVIKKLPETSLENFYINRFGKVLYSMFFESYTEKVWGIHPSKISADWGAQRVKGLSILEVLKDIINKKLNRKNKQNTETSLIEQFMFPKLGAGQLFEEMANEVINHGGKIILNARVTNLHLTDGKIDEITYNNGKNKKLKCDICISSLAISDLINQIDDKKMNKEVKRIATNLPYRAFMSVGIIVDKLRIENTTSINTLNDVIPDSWIYMQEPNVKIGRIQVLNNWSPYMFKTKEESNKKAIICLEYFCNEEDKYWKMSDKEFIKFAINEAVSLNIINKEDVEDTVRIKFPKAYPAYFGTYSKIDKVISYLNDIENLYCIGRNGQHRYNNMDHSMLTGIEAAKNIINNIKDKNNIWSVNTEKSYHEKK